MSTKTIKTHSNKPNKVGHKHKKEKKEKKSKTPKNLGDSDIGTFPNEGNFNISTDLVRSNVKATDIFTVPIKFIATAKRTTGSIILNEPDHGFYGFNGHIWTPFKTPPAGLSTVLAVSNDAGGQDIVNVGTLQGDEIDTLLVNATTMSIGSMSLSGPIDMGGNDIVNVNYLETNTITATLLTGNISSFERIGGLTSTISTNIINTLVESGTGMGFDWAARVGGEGNEASTCVAVNRFGKIALVGTFDNTIAIYNASGATAATMSSTVNGDSFIIKYSSGGSPEWVTKLGGTSDQTATSCAITDSGVIYVGGSYTMSLNVYDNGGLNIISSLGGSSTLSAFVSKWASAGGFQWTNRLAGDDGVEVLGISADPSDNIVATGYYRSSPLNIYQGGTITLSLPYSGNVDGFVAKWNSAGNLQWGTRISSPDYEAGIAIATNKVGDIILAGNSTGTLYIYSPGSTTIVASLSPIGALYGFLVKWNSSGDYQWSTKIASWISVNASVAMNDVGDIVSAGFYNSIAEIYDVTTTTVPIATIPSSGGLDTFIVKWDPTGKYKWSTRVINGDQQPSSVAMNVYGDVLLTGYYKDYVYLSIYSQPGYTIAATLAADGDKDVFIVKWDTNGNYLSRTKIVSANSKEEVGRSIATNNWGDIVVTGTYTSTPNYLKIYDTNLSFVASLPFDSGTDSFLVKWNSTIDLNLGNPALDGQPKTITSGGPQVRIVPSGTINSYIQNVRLDGNEAVSLLWDAIEGNWIIIDNTGSLV